MAMPDQDRGFGVIFDMDGVLIDSNPYHKKSLKSFAQKYGYELNEDALRAKIYGRQNKDWIPRLFEREMSADEIERYAVEKESLFQKIFRKDVAPVTGLIPFLDVLKEENIPRAIATSAPRMNVDFVFEHTPIGGYFGLVLDDSHIKRGKPDPEAYLKASELLGFEPGQCVVFEDSLSGVESARNAGCRVIAVGTTHEEDEFGPIDLFIRDFSHITLEDLARLFI
jgi:HAD superfamily hydrolase (TIGR01509 family)